MAKAIVNPQEVRKFASELKRFSAELDQNIARTQGKLNQLGSSWQDIEHKKFEQQFQQSIKTLKPLIQDIQQYIGFLGRKATAAEKYLSQR